MDNFFSAETKKSNFIEIFFSYVFAKIRICATQHSSRICLHCHSTDVVLVKNNDMIGGKQVYFEDKKSHWICLYCGTEYIDV